MLVGWGIPLAIIGLYDTAIGQGFLPNNCPRLGELLNNWNTHWLYIWLVIGALLFITVTFEGTYRIYRKAVKNDISQIVEELLSIGIYTDVPVNITRVLYHDKEKLAVGLFDGATSNMDKLVLSQLNLRKIVGLEQRKVRVYGSDNVRDEGYWVLTELGKDVVLYLQKNQQVLHKEGSLSQ